MKKAVSAVMIAVVIAGCNSPGKITKTHRVVAGKTIPRPAVQTVRGYEIVNTYHLGRRIDPNNPNIMYEAGKMYVIRRSPTWNLRPNTPIGNPVPPKRRDPLKVKFENMKKQQALVAERNKHIEKVRQKLFKVENELSQTNDKKLNEDSFSELKKVQENLGKVKRKMAELD